MKIHHLDCGSMCPLGGRLFDAAPGVMRAAHLVCHCLLVETSAGLVLVDTGLGTRDAYRPHPRLSHAMTALLRPRLRFEQTAFAQVRALGFAPSDVRHIVLTHLDFDHAGGLQDFPDARVHVMADELDAVQHRRGWVARRRYRPAQWDGGTRWRTYRAQGSRWFGFERVRELDGLGEDIAMIPLCGHTRGHAGVAVRGQDGWVLLAGDAYFHHGEMPATRDTPATCPPGLRAYQRMMEIDREARLRNQQRLRELAWRHGDEVRVVCSHDALELAAARAGLLGHGHPRAQANAAVHLADRAARAAGAHG